MTDTRTASLAAPLFLTRAQVAELLQLSEQTIYQLVERRLIPFHRVCRRLRFLREDVLTFVRRTRVDARDPDHYGGPQDQG